MIMAAQDEKGMLLTSGLPVYVNLSLEVQAEVLAAYGRGVQFLYPDLSTYRQDLVPSAVTEPFDIAMT